MTYVQCQRIIILKDKEGEKRCIGNLEFNDSLKANVCNKCGYIERVIGKH